MSEMQFAENTILTFVYMDVLNLGGFVTVVLCNIH